MMQNNYAPDERKLCRMENITNQSKVQIIYVNWAIQNIYIVKKRNAH